MSEDQLYELARKRIDRRNRRGILLGANFLGFMVFVGVFVVFSDVLPHKLGALIAMIWLGLLAFHVIMLDMTKNRDQVIEEEVARLREQVWEKPKRLEADDTSDDTDGELIDFPDTSSEKINRKSRG